MTNVNSGTEVEFELPELEESSGVRVHSSPGDSVCISCEG